MIYSKANLQVVSVASRDAFDKALNGVLFSSDGSTVAGNGKLIVAVGPADMSKSFIPDSAGDQIRPQGIGTLMPVGSVNTALRNMPKDKRPELQYIAMTRVKDPTRVGLTSVSANGDATTNSSVPKSEQFPNWKEAVRTVDSKQRICLNRQDLIDLLKCMEAACPLKGEFNPIYIDVGDNGAVLRCQNYITGQRAVGVLTSYNTKGEWLTKDKWEKDVFGVKAKRRIKK